MVSKAGNGLQPHARPEPRRVRRLLEEAGIGPDLANDEQAERLAAYTDLLAAWNRKTNLVGPRAWEEIFTTLVLDSTHLARFLSGLSLPARPEAWDLGAGAGLPGIPLRLLWTPGTYHLVEVREKRVLFMRTALARLEAPNTAVHAEPALAFMKSRRAAGVEPDLILSRAFMPWRALLDLVEPYARAGTRVIIMANTPVELPLPAFWSQETVSAYTLSGNQRFFWSLQRATA